MEQLPERAHDDFLRRFTAAQPVLRRFILAHLPDFHQAEDALQEAALALWRKFGEYRPGESFAAWAFGVARREVLHSRRAAARGRLVFDDELTGRLAVRLQETEPLLAPRRNLLAGCLERLAERYRRAVTLKYEGGQPAAGIAAVLGTTEVAARILLCRARRALADCLERAARLGGEGEEPA